MSFIASTSSADAHEILMAPVPKGFKVLSQSVVPVQAQELIPDVENKETWTRMITVQSFPVPASVTPAAFLRDFGGRFMTGCPSGDHTNILNGKTGDFNSSALVLRCPGEGQGVFAQTLFVKAIRGSGKMYVGQVSLRGESIERYMEFARSYLESFVVRYKPR